MSKPRIVPSALETERAALGLAVRGDQEAAEVISQELEGDDFYDNANRAVYRAIKALVDEGLQVNPVSLAERSGIALSEIEDLGAKAGTVGPSHLKTLVSDLGRIGALRNTYYACNDTLSRLTKDAKLEEVQEILERGLYQAQGQGQKAQEAKDGASVLGSVIDDFIHRHASGGGVEISTGLMDLDRAIIGLRPGKNIVIAGRPSMGKTALADSIRRAVVKQGYGAISFSLEMQAEELCERELAFQARTNLRKILAAKDVTPEELERIKNAVGSLSSGLWAIEDSTYSISGIRRKARIIARRMARAGTKVGIVILDYIQLAGDNGDGREQSVAAISRGCKLMAKELGCSVLALSQLNRQCELRDDKRPLMSDLRESGSIEQDADIVAFVYREHMYDNSFPPEESELIIRKHRSGPTGTVHLKYNPKHVVFEDRVFTVAGDSNGTQGLPSQ
jgi:replicative DNA helicase